MKKIFRVIYPFLIYMGIANVLTIAAAVVVSVCYVLLSMAGKVSDVQNVSWIMGWITQNLLYITAAAAVVTAIILAWFYKRDCIMRGKNPKGEFSLPKGWIYPFFLGISLCFLGNNLIGLLKLDVLFPSYEAVAETLYVGTIWGQLLCVGILIPITEEMVFRILGFRRLRDDWGFWQSALLSSLLFGLYHGNMVQFLYAFMLGFAIAYAYEQTDNPVVPIIIHMIANVTSVIWTSWAGEAAGGMVITILITAISAVITVVCLKKIKEYGRIAGLTQPHLGR